MKADTATILTLKVSFNLDLIAVLVLNSRLTEGKRWRRRHSLLEMCRIINVRHLVFAFGRNETRKIAILVLGNLPLMMAVAYSILFISPPIRVSSGSVGRVD
jgi:hypothetical protein